MPVIIISSNQQLISSKLDFATAGRRWQLGTQAMVAVATFGSKRLGALYLCIQASALASGGVL